MYDEFQRGGTDFVDLLIEQGQCHFGNQAMVSNALISIEFKADAFQGVSAPLQL